MADGTNIMPASETKQASRNLRVLIVEDEALISLMIETMLRDLGHEPAACVHSVPQALEFLKNSSVSADAALLDINLAGDAVYPVAEALAEMDIPFAFLTGYGAFGVPAEFSHAIVLHKPFSERDVSEAVESLQQQIMASLST